MSNAYSRRAVIAGTGAVIAGTAVGACGEVVRTADAPPSGTPLGKVSGIPVGGGEIFAEAGVVVCQPEEGKFKAYSAICTHRGCKVTAVRDGQITCECHYSVFNMKDGTVTSGPAKQPLPEFGLKVDGDEIQAV
ncbi:Rieske (2Fe-2S) protein [Lentzea tibetensis]|uniref:Cytochrome bc1 complex Rieske iron-sulfur subunit n=1 Tax=Lentzea tibetensis TaxID=2591470 RepID=A0A563ENG8_9PSEU|nr:Rieske (2Fe-2S) protein [Lentzea tibetensis]TWP48814.1 Rieske (2Fe-2S) protein [Lentzea tibetensis]